MVIYNSKNSYANLNNYFVLSYGNSGYSKESYSPKKMNVGCTCFGTGCKGTCRM